MPETSPVPDLHDFKVGCICPLEIELAPVIQMLDEIYQYGKPSQSYTWFYTLGRIGNHNIVIATLSKIGNNTAATVATQLVHEFPSIRFGLLVGIGGGLPSDKHDIRLGDVVVSRPRNDVAAVVQLDMGKHGPNDKFTKIGQLDPPPPVLMNATHWLEAHHQSNTSTIAEHIDKMLGSSPEMVDNGYCRPESATDKLFTPSYSHPEVNTSCDHCDDTQLVPRPSREKERTKIFYGPIGSSNAVIKDAARAAAYSQQGFFCVEMEAAGIMDSFPCLVIRGICDYADSHKQKVWQRYAAAVASGYMKELLLHIDPEKVSSAVIAQPAELPTLEQNDLSEHNTTPLQVRHRHNPTPTVAVLRSLVEGHRQFQARLLPLPGLRGMQRFRRGWFSLGGPFALQTTY
ncbi:nucleoside phosphorylase domain-containing protein [Elsinoe ampelina]|uniref:Nucleoside phosphorylase domain-containing protein n=1 Tax=Elsinoe ampelina TaxID=302913 RepID=A0A6A6G5G4_9PEZI|nr:nucleoside phosphorylase domain-containing protein [Elsinoe ampelina]